MSEILANPQGGNVTAGSATISNVSPNVLQIRQNSAKAVIDWHSYNINPNQTTQYIQPSTKAIILNRIDAGSGPSMILGKLSANGQVWLVNPAGIVFGSGSHVDVAGLLATTANITNADFMAGNYHFAQSPNYNGAVINNGTITIKDKGMAALVAPGVENNGIISANLGRVVLAAGNVYTVDFYGDQLISFGVGAAVTKPAVDSSGKELKDAVSNSGRIIASGGKVLMTAQTAAGVLDHSINMSGYVEARAAKQQGGSIILMGGDNGVVKVSGTMVASGTKPGQTGGTVKVLGKHVQVVDNASIDVSGDQGGGTILIGGNFHGEGFEPNADTTYVSSHAKLNADALTNGNGGNVAVWSNLDTQFYGNISARGGALGGNGGFVETSGHNLDVTGATVNTLAPHGVTGTWLLDPANVTISTADTGYYNNLNTFNPTSGSATSTINTTTLDNALATSSIVITTTNSGTSGGSAGTITVSNPIAWSSTASLTLTAASTIAINSSITTGAVGSGLILNAAGAVTQAAGAIIGGSGSLTQSGSGTVTLSNANTYSGGTNVTAGTLAVTNTNGLGTSGAIAVSNNGILNFNMANNSTLANSGTITLANSATLSDSTAAGNLNILNNPVILSAGSTPTITATNSTAVLSFSSSSSTVITNNTAALTFNGAGNINIAGNAVNTGIGSGSGTVTMSGTGTLTSIIPWTYSGATTINAGTIKLTTATGTAVNTAFTVNQGGTLLLDNSQIGANSNNARIANALTLNGGTLQLNGSNTASTNVNETVGELILPEGASTINLTSGTGGSTELTFSGISNTSISRTAGATILFSGTNLGANPGAGNTNIFFTFPSNLLLTGGNGAANSKNINIVPYALGTVTAGGTGANFVTYNIDTNSNSNGIRPLIAAEYANTLIAGDNISLTSGTTNASAISINSLIFNGGLLNFNANNTTLTDASGALADISSTGTVIASNNNTTRAIQFGATGTAEAIISTIPMTATITIQPNLITSGGLTVSGTGINTGTTGASGTVSTLSLATVAKSITGGIIVNSGILQDGIANAFSTSQALTIRAAGKFDLNNLAITLTSLALESGGTEGSILDLHGNSGKLTLSGNINHTLSGSGTTGGLVGAQIKNSTGTGSLSLSSNSAQNFTVTQGTGSAASDLTISAVISNTGTGGITKLGSGLLTFSGTNTYTSPTTINAGTLSVGTIAAGGTSSNLGAATASATNLVLGGGTLQYTGATASTNRPFSLTTGTTSNIQVTNSLNTLTMSGISTGGSTGNLNINGSGGLTFTNANTYTGMTTVSSGTLTANVANALFSGSSLNVAGGTFAIGAGFNQSVAGVTLTSGIITGTTGTLTGTSYTLDSGTISAILAGTSGVTKTTSGTVYLTGANTYTGQTVIQAGVLSGNTILNAGAGASSFGNPTGGNATILIGTSGSVSSGTLQYTGTGSSSSRPINLQGNSGSSGTIDASGSGTLTLSGGISTTGTSGLSLFFTGSGAGTESGAISNLIGAVTKNGPNTWTLGSASNVYTGSTTVNNGTLTQSVANSLPSTTNLTINSPGIYDLASNALSVTDLSGTGTLTDSGTAATFTDTPAATSADSFSGLISGTTSITLNAATNGTNTGSLSLSDTANSYSGTTTVTQGTLSYNSIASGTNSALGSASSAINIGATGILKYVGSGDTSTRQFNITNGGVIDASGGGLLTLSATTLVANSGNLILDGTGTGSITGTVDSTTATSLTKNGTGTWTLSGSNTYTGATTINNGTLSVPTLTSFNTPGPLGNPSSGAIVLGSATAATLSYTGSSVAINRTFSIGGSGGGTISVTTAGQTLTLNGAIDGAFPLTLSGAGNITLGAAIGGNTALSTFTSSAALTTINTTTIKTSGNQLYSGAVSLTAAPTLNSSSGNGSITFSNTLNGAQALIINSGSGAVAFNGAVGGTTPLSSLTVTGGAITQSNSIAVSGASSFSAGTNPITLTNASNDFVGAVTLSNSGSNNANLNNNAALVLAASTVGNLNVTASGAITQSGILTVSGTSTFDINASAPASAITLSSNNRFSGNVSILNAGSTVNAVSLTNSGTATALSLGNIGSSGHAISGNILGVASDAGIILNGTIYANPLVAANSIVLAGTTFTNNTGSSALNPGTLGRFLVWSGNPANDIRGGLVYNFKQYNATYPGSSVSGTGNGFLYTLAPMITPSLTGTVSKVYDTTTVATLAGSNYSNSGAVDGDIVTLNNPATGAYATQNVGSNIKVSVTGIALISPATNGSASVYGYQLSSTSANANIGTITTAPLTITANAQSKTYGTNDPTFTYQSTGLLTGDSLTGALSRTISLANENVGTYPILQGTLSNSNYNITYVGANETINKAGLTISATAANKTYGTSDPTLSYTNSGLVNGVTVDGVTINDTLSGSLARASYGTLAGEQVGTFAISQGSVVVSSPSNYNTTFNSANLTIAKAALAINATAANKTYGTTDPTLSYTNTGLVNGVTVDGVTLNDTLSGSLTRASFGTLAGEQVGAFAISQGSVAASDPTNYTTTFNTANLTINKAALAIDATAANKTYGTTDPTLTYTNPGLVNGVTVDGVTINDTLSGSLARASYGTLAGEQVGTFAISQGTVVVSAPGNYNTTFNSANLTIAKAALAINATAANKTYGTSDPTLNYTNTGLVNGVTVDGVTLNDTLSGSLTRASFGTLAGEQVGAFAISQGSVAASDPTNYTTTFNTANLTIN
ncbi:MAG: MBG domain-containing protein, partial [Gammaproteobacteria bacterium]